MKLTKPKRYFMKKNEELSILEKALKRFAEALAVNARVTPIAIDGAIQRFEFCYELMWKVLKKTLLTRENIDIQSPRQVLQQAYTIGWIQDEKLWLKMAQDRNLTSHTYQEELALNIYRNLPDYLQAMQKVCDNLKKPLS